MCLFYWLGYSYIIIDGYMGVWEIFFLEGLELKVKGFVIMEEGRKSDFIIME